MVVTKTHTDIWSLCASSGTLIAIPEHLSSISLIHKSLREQTLNLQIGLHYCGESH